jgi:hypothetical protein
MDQKPQQIVSATTKIASIVAYRGHMQRKATTAATTAQADSSWRVKMKAAGR